MESAVLIREKGRGLRHSDQTHLRLRLGCMLFPIIVIRLFIVDVDSRLLKLPAKRLQLLFGYSPAPPRLSRCLSSLHAPLAIVAFWYVRLQ